MKRDWTIISVDDHLLEPPDLWQSRLPAQYRDAGPRVVSNKSGEFWEFEGERKPTSGLAAAAGRSSDEISLEPVPYAEMRPGCYDPLARIADMDQDGVLASLSFPSFGRYCGQAFSEAKDKKLGLLCVQAYNDFIIDEWYGTAPGRLIPLVVIPLWDTRLAVTELERVLAKGAKALSFSENPAKLGLPSIHNPDRYWDPVFSLVEEANIPLCMHIGSSSHVPSTAGDAPELVRISTTPLNALYTLADWLLSDVLVRFPKLTLCLSEGGIGWIPYMLERLDYSWDRHHAWNDSPLAAPPSEYFAQHVMGCFIDDEHGIDSLEEIGPENVMVETDYPHPDSAWPNSQLLIQERLGDLEPAIANKILRENAMRVFNFSPSAIGQP